MRYSWIILVAVAAVGGVSCTQNAPAGGGTATAKPADAGTTDSGIPRDAQWTIYCTTVNGPAHLQQAKATRDHLARNTQMRDWYIVQGDGYSTLYHGYYREIDERAQKPEDRQEAIRAQTDRKTIAGMVDATSGQKLFRSPVLVPLDSADPAAPAEWNLVNVRQKGYYSLQVGVYKDHPQRKEAAIEAVREARAAGIEAYYFHGPSGSSVCVGVWPESAVLKQTPRPEISAQDRNKLTPQYRQILEDPNYAHARNPNEVLLLVPGSMPMPRGQLTTPDGKPVEVVQPRVQIVDPTLLATMKRFPTHSINGVEAYEVLDPKTGQKKETKRPSVLVVIPQDSVAERRPTVEPGLADPAGPVAPVGPTVDVTPPPTAPEPPVTPPAGRLPTSKGGRLRTIEDK